MAMKSSKTEQAELIQDLPADFVADILISLEEVDVGNVLEYQFSLVDLLADVTTENKHSETNWGKPVGKERRGL